MDVQGERKGGFTHCAKYGGALHNNNNPFNGKDQLFDPVDEAEAKYSPTPCGFKICENNGVIVATDPDLDLIPAASECGNAAAVALRYDVAVSTGVITIEMTPPDLGEVTYPVNFPALDTNPKISGIVVKTGRPRAASSACMVAWRSGWQFVMRTRTSGRSPRP